MQQWRVTLFANAPEFACLRMQILAAVSACTFLEVYLYCSVTIFLELCCHVEETLHLFRFFSVQQQLPECVKYLESDK